MASEGLLVSAARFLSDARLDGRAPGSEGHRLAAEYLLEQMKGLGLEPLFAEGFCQQIFDGDQVVGTNLGGRYGVGGQRSILIGAETVR